MTKISKYIAHLYFLHFIIFYQNAWTCGQDNLCLVLWLSLSGLLRPSVSLMGFTWLLRSLQVTNIPDYILFCHCEFPRPICIMTTRHHHDRVNEAHACRWVRTSSTRRVLIKLMLSKPVWINDKELHDAHLLLMQSYVIMKGRKKNHYCFVLRALVEVQPQLQSHLRRIIHVNHKRWEGKGGFDAMKKKSLISVNEAGMNYKRCWLGWKEI